MGCDYYHSDDSFNYGEFQSTHPGWGATLTERYVLSSLRFQSTHPGWGATYFRALAVILFICFNPRTPGGVRLWTAPLLVDNFKFQSTHPGWGATFCWHRGNSCGEVSIHAPRVGCDWILIILPMSTLVSIHAPRVGCDLIPLQIQIILVKFQSTHPGWGATLLIIKILPILKFQSTHPGWGATQKELCACLRC